MKSIRIVFAILLLISVFSLNESIADDIDNSESGKLLKQGDDLFNSDSIEEALSVYQQAVEKAQTEKNSSVLTESYSQTARCFLRTDRKEEGRTWLQKAAAIASENDPLGWSRFLGVRGRFEWKDAAARAKEPSPETDKASNTFKQMYVYSTEHGLYDRAIDAANMVSITCRLGERVEWALKGIEAAENGNVESMLGPLWNNLGWTYDDLERYDESLKALEKARVYHYKRGDELSMLIADWSVGHALRMTGQIDSAEAVLDVVQKWAFIRKSEEKSPENSEWVGWANLELGEIMLIKGDRDRALGMIKVAYRNLSEAGMREWDPKKLEELNQRIIEITRQKP